MKVASIARAHGETVVLPAGLAAVQNKSTATASQSYREALKRRPADGTLKTETFSYVLSLAEEWKQDKSNAELGGLFCPSGAPTLEKDQKSTRFVLDLEICVVFFFGREGEWDSTLQFLLIRCFPSVSLLVSSGSRCVFIHSFVLACLARAHLTMS